MVNKRYVSWVDPDPTITKEFIILLARIINRLFILERVVLMVIFSIKAC